MTIYTTGTVSVTNGDAVVTGSGTAWAVALIAGGIFSSAGMSVPIASVDSDTSLTLAYAWPGTTATGAVYAIARENSEAADIVDLNDKLSRVLVTLSLAGITPNASGTIAERDAFTLAVGDKGFLFLHAELGYDFEFYRWNGSSWEGPFATRGIQGASGLIGIWRGPWITATSYFVNDAVSQGGSSYICVTAHTSGTFATDLAAGKWQLVAQKGDTSGVTSIAGLIGAITAVDLRDVLDASSYTIKPSMFGAVGGGVVDDGAALNAMFDYVRTLIAAQGNKSNIGLTIDLSGIWRTTVSINATGLTAWSLQIKGGLIVGECAGKCVLDLVGSRGYTLDNVAVYGEKTNMPSVGLQTARSTANPSCDNHSWRDVSTTGWFSTSAMIDYGAETTHYDHLTIFNYNNNAYVAVFQNEQIVGMSSDYQTIVTGVQSFINKKLTNCDFRYLPQGLDEVVTVTGITNAANAVVTAPGHQFVNGNQVCFVNGMFGLDKFIGTVSAATANTFTVNIDTTAIGAFNPTAALAVKVQTHESVFLQGSKQMRWDDCYIVAYGQPHMSINFTTNTKVMEQITLDMLFEGAGTASNVSVRMNGFSCNIQSFVLKTYSSAAGANLILTDTSVGSALALYKPIIESVRPKYSVPLLATGSNAYVAFYFADILYRDIANVAYASYAAFNGCIRDINSGKVTEITADPVDQTYTPTASSGTGTVTTFGAVVGTVRGGLGKMTWLELDVPITTNGTGATDIRATLPVGITPARDAFLIGLETVSGKTIVGQLVASSGTVTIRNYDASYPGASGARMKLSGWFERS